METAIGILLMLAGGAVGKTGEYTTGDGESYGNLACLILAAAGVLTIIHAYL